VVMGLGRDNAHPMQESAFFGNIFVSPPQAYYCNGFDWDRGPVSGRIGANQSGSPYTNPFGTNALCESHCTTIGFWGEAYSGCGSWGNNVVTVFRDFDPNVPYTICNPTTKLCLDVLNWSTSANGVIDPWPATAGQNQKFFFERVNAVSDSGQYRIRSAQSNLYLTMKGASTKSGGALIQWPYEGTTNQLWYMTQVVEGSYNLVNVNSGMQLTVGGIAQGGQVIQIPGGGYSNTEMFKLTLSQ